MNQMDRAAEPMTGVLTDRANLTPYTVQPNQIPLDLGIGIAAPAPAPAAAAPAATPAPVAAVARRWVQWSAHQRFTGPRAVEDAANPAQLNRIDWYAATSWTRPYPGDKTILAPDEVPGRHLPAQDLGGG